MPILPSGAEKQEAISHVESFISRCEELNNEQHEKFVNFYALYALKDDSRQVEPWLSNLQITGAFEFVERPFAAMVANTPSFELVDTEPGGKQVVLEKAIIDEKSAGGDGFTEIRPQLKIPFKEIYESDLDAMWKVRSMKKVLREFTKGGLIYGTYHAEIRQQILEREEYAPILGEEGEEEVDYLKIIEQITPEVALVEPFDVVVSPFARDPEDAIENYGGFAIVRNNQTLRDLDPEVYGNLDELKEVMSGEEIIDSHKQEKEQEVANAADTQFTKDDNVFDVVEMWTWFGDKGEEKKRIISLANGVIIRFEEIPEGEEMPVTVFKDQEVPGQYWGIGEIEPIVADLHEENTMKNQRVDLNNRLLNEEWMVRSDAGVDLAQFVSKPHNIIVSDDISDTAIRQVQRTTAPLAASGEDIDRIRRNMIATTGSIAIEASGDEGGITNTATGEIIRQRAAVARYQAKTENLEFAVADIARKMLRIKAKNLQDGEKVPVFVRGKWREVDAKLYKENLDKYEVTVRGGSMNVKNSVSERNDKIALVNIGLQAKQLGMDVNMEELYRDLLGSFPDVDVDKVLPRAIPVSATPMAGLPAPEQQAPEGLGPITEGQPLEAPAPTPGVPGGMSEQGLPAQRAINRLA